MFPRSYDKQMAVSSGYSIPDQDGTKTASGRRLLRRFLCLVLMVATTIGIVAPGCAIENPKPTQSEVEAAYLFNFGKFITWPRRAATSGPFVICVLGDDAVGPALDKIVVGEHIDSRLVEGKRISRVQEAAGCTILYISITEASRISRILAALNDAPVLTVSDIPDFLTQGGMIQFVLREGRVRFEVNLTPAEHEGLVMSSELLKVAVEVKRDKGGVR